MALKKRNPEKSVKKGYVGKALHTGLFVVKLYVVNRLILEEGIHLHEMTTIACLKMCTVKAQQLRKYKE